MSPVSATYFRANMSSVLDDARETPQFIRRTRDECVLASKDFITRLLPDSIDVRIQRDGEQFLATSPIETVPVIGTGSNQASAIRDFAESLLDYANDVFGDFKVWGSAPNVSSNLPLLFSVYCMGNADVVEEACSCRLGES